VEGVEKSEQDLGTKRFDFERKGDTRRNKKKEGGKGGHGEKGLGEKVLLPKKRTGGDRVAKSSGKKGSKCVERDEDKRVEGIVSYGPKIKDDPEIGCFLRTKTPRGNGARDKIKSTEKR